MIKVINNRLHSIMSVYSEGSNKLEELELAAGYLFLDIGDLFESKYCRYLQGNDCARGRRQKR